MSRTNRKRRDRQVNMQSFTSHPGGSKWHRRAVANGKQDDFGKVKPKQARIARWGSLASVI